MELFGTTILGIVHAPIGIDIGAETPQEIAVSIIAELIKIRSAA
jgi:xanthine dehydrogenase accessory factor